jgi:hypothetical protein
LFASFFTIALYWNVVHFISFRGTQFCKALILFATWTWS